MSSTFISYKLLTITSANSNQQQHMQDSNAQACMFNSNQLVLIFAVQFMDDISIPTLGTSIGSEGLSDCPGRHLNVT